MKKRSVFLAAMAVAAVVSAQCSGSPSSSPVSPSSSSLGATRLALGDTTDDTPELGFAKVCKLGNVDGTFETTKTAGPPPADIGDNTVQSPMDVSTGLTNCKVVAMYVGPDAVDRGTQIAIHENPATYYVSSVVKGVTQDQNSGVISPVAEVAYIDNTNRWLNQYHGWVFTYTNNMEEAPAEGRMTGGGSVFTGDNKRVTHGFELHCNVNDLPNNLEVNWGGNGKNANNFHLTSLDTAVCTDDPNIAPEPPDAGFDTFTATGTGKLNNVPGATIEFIFTDAGQPGKNDRAMMIIYPPGGGAPVLVVDNTLQNGNQQAHK